MVTSRKTMRIRVDSGKSQRNNLAKTEPTNSAPGHALESTADPLGKLDVSMAKHRPARCSTLYVGEV